MRTRVCGSAPGPPVPAHVRDAANAKSLKSRLSRWYIPCLESGMRMRIIGRHDPVLFAGLTLALLVVFQRSIQVGLDVAREVEQTYGVALLPALLILTVMFVFHQQAKRREMKAETAAAATEARLARARADELEQLMLFGQALARALSTDALRETVWRHLPTLSDGADAWLVLRTDAGWERLTDVSCSHWPAGDIERIADEAAARPLEEQEAAAGVAVNGHTCFMMLVGSTPVGVLALAPKSSSQGTRQKMGAAAALLTIAVRNAQLFANVREYSVKDGLTGCFNRAHTLEILDGELGRSRRAATSLSLVLFDVDNFKRINDRYGHLSGDSVLAAVGQRIRQVLRKSDVRCRYGGDEFLVVLPETDAAGAARVAEWIRSEMEQIVIAPSGERLAFTISAGTATGHAGELIAPARIDRADQALSQAKANGRNCIRTAGDVTLARSLDEDRSLVLTTH
jgi:diguanylate cyclase (GGDEF)-like protein